MTRAPEEILAIVDGVAVAAARPGSRCGQQVPLRDLPAMPAEAHARFLDLVTAQTGGRVVRIRADTDAPGWHELTVRVKGKSVKVTARRGYFAQ